MRKIYKIIAAFLMVIPGLNASGQSSADQLVLGLKDKMNRIISFHVYAKIIVDVDFISIKDRQVSIHYQAPDKFEFDADGLALLPKNGMQMEYMTLLKDDYTAIDAGQEVINNFNSHIIKIIPESIESDIILAQLWVDPDNIRIIRMKTFTRKSGSYLIDFEYLQNKDILPSRLVVTFEISNMSIPVKMMNDFMKDPGAKPDSLPKEARVTVEYSNYRITAK